MGGFLIATGYLRKNGSSMEIKNKLFFSV